jgi:hypothetical protein
LELVPGVTITGAVTMDGVKNNQRAQAGGAVLGDRISPHLKHP